MSYPFSYRLFKQAPVPPVLLCLLLMVVLGGGYVVISVQSGLLDKVLSGQISSIELRATFTVMLLTAYIPMAQYYLIKWSQQHWQSLTKFVDKLPPLDFHLSRFWGLLGMSLLFGLFFGPFWVGGDVFESNFWNLSIVVQQIFVTAYGWLLFRLLASLVRYANQFSQVARSSGTLDLFSTEFSKVFVRQGVRSALLMVGFFSICGNLIVAPGGRYDVAILIVVVATLCAVLALITPALGIRKRTWQEKQKHLGNIQKQLPALAGSINRDDADWTKIAALLALESRIQAVREWPFDASSISRFIFYIAIGLCSWVGAALVEKLIETFI